MRANLAAVMSAVLLGIGLPAGAQAPPPDQTSAVPTPPPAETQKESRYQIGVMERVLEGAVEHGASITRDRLQTLVPATMLLADNARVRGFRLDGYGVFFDVVVPDLYGTLPWSLRTLDQNDLGLENALKAIKAHIDAANDQNLEQAFKRVELQVGPLPVTAAPSPTRTSGGGPAAGVPAAAAQAPVQSDAILSNPDEAYRSDVRHALMNAMLDYGGPLGVGADEWLTVAARRSDERPRLAPSDSEVRTMIIRVKGADLSAFREGRLSREEALKRMEVRVF
jgi:hypothetical protein